MGSSQAILGLLRTIDEGEPDEQCFAAHRLAALLEAEEAKYRAVVGDPHANPSLRNHYAVGKILAFIKVRAAQWAVRRAWRGSKAAAARRRPTGWGEAVTGAQGPLGPWPKGRVLAAAW